MLNCSPILIQIQKLTEPNPNPPHPRLIWWGWSPGCSPGCGDLWVGSCRSGWRRRCRQPWRRPWTASGPCRRWSSAVGQENPTCCRLKQEISTFTGLFFCCLRFNFSTCTHVETVRRPSLGFFPGCRSQADRSPNSSSWFALDLEDTHTQKKKRERRNTLISQQSYSFKLPTCRNREDGNVREDIKQG